MNLQSEKIERFSHIVVGGGLSGLLICRGLQQANRNWLLLEARPVLGGRLKNADQHCQIDMGAAWIWPEHQPHMRQLIKDLDIKTFGQPDDQSSIRFQSGAVQIIHKIASLLEHNRIRLNTPVRACRLVSSNGETMIHLETSSKDSFACRQVIFAVPPKLLDQHVVFDPPLSHAKQVAMHASHTWMAGVTKISLVYPRKYWKGCSNMGLGGFPAFQVYDGSTEDGSVAALTFFALATEILNDVELAQRVASQMSQHWTRIRHPAMAEQAHSFTSHHVQRWPNETYISEDDKPNCIYPHPMPVVALATSNWNGALLFAGSESDLTSPGVMEGAVGAAKRVLKELNKT